MLIFASRVVPFVALGVSVLSILYVGCAVWAVAAFGRRGQSPGGFLEPVTILKPVCGLDADLEANLRSFCEQDYPVSQVVFGVRDADDPATEVIERIIRDFPERDLTLVVSGRVIGTNFKVCNLANMCGAAKHDVLVVADSDMRVGRGYLKAVVSPFRDPGVGATTCLYRGSPARGLFSVLGSMFINDWFVPSVLVAQRLQRIRFCLGATMAVRRSALMEIGGFQALASHLADDYMLGKLISDRGYRVHLTRYVVENRVLEPNLKSLFLHELRWARTVRSVQPVGFAFSFITDAVPMSVIFLAVTHMYGLGLAVVASAVGARVALHYAVRRSLGIPGEATPWLIPIRDALSFAVRAASFFGRAVLWREQKFSVQSNGHLVVEGRALPEGGALREGRALPEGGALEGRALEGGTLQE